MVVGVKTQNKIIERKHHPHKEEENKMNVVIVGAASEMSRDEGSW
jgi:hypothetical protein